MSCFTFPYSHLSKQFFRKRILLFLHCQTPSALSKKALQTQTLVPHPLYYAKIACIALFALEVGLDVGIFDTVGFFEVGLEVGIFEVGFDVLGSLVGLLVLACLGFIEEQRVNN